MDFSDPVRRYVPAYAVAEFDAEATPHRPDFNKPLFEPGRQLVFDWPVRLSRGNMGKFMGNYHGQLIVVGRQP